MFKEGEEKSEKIGGREEERREGELGRGKVENAEEFRDMVEEKGEEEEQSRGGRLQQDMQHVAGVDLVRLDERIV